MASRGDWKQWSKGKPTLKQAALPRTPSMLTTSERRRQQASNESVGERKSKRRRRQERKQAEAAARREAARVRHSGSPSDRRPPSGPAERYPMSDEEREAARQLGTIQFDPDSWEDKFSHGLATIAFSESPLLTQRQRLYLWKLVHQMRGKINDQHLLTIAREVHQQSRAA